MKNNIFGKKFNKKSIWSFFEFKLFNIDLIVFNTNLTFFTINQAFSSLNLFFKISLLFYSTSLFLVLVSLIENVYLVSIYIVDLKFTQTILHIFICVYEILNA